MKPVVGMGATLIVGSDKYAFEVTLVHGPKKISAAHVREQWNDNVRVFTLRSNGRWVRCGDDQHSGSWLVLGRQEEYRDPSF